MHGLFAGVLPAQHVLPLPVDAASEAALAAHLAEHGGRIAAMLVEPRVQGAGGMRFHDDAVLRRLRRLADAHDVLLIFDEIFVGFGRTGDLFACQGSGVTPDIAPPRAPWSVTRILTSRPKPKRVGPPRAPRPTKCEYRSCERLASILAMRCSASVRCADAVSNAAALAATPNPANAAPAPAARTRNSRRFIRSSFTVGDH